MLVTITIITIFIFPFDSFREWSNHNHWLNNPQKALPNWIILFSDNLFPHTTLDFTKDAILLNNNISGINTISHSYDINLDHSIYPQNFQILYIVKNDSNIYLDINITRPDGKVFTIYSKQPSLSQTVTKNEFSGRILSNDEEIFNQLQNYDEDFTYKHNLSSFAMIFSDINKNHFLKGKYTLNLSFYIFEKAEIIQSQIILGGDTYGFLGTDKAGRDIALGILWATPFTLFVGFMVSTVSVLIGLIYGTIAGYKGGKIDGFLMRISDIIYCLPSLPLLIILTYSVKDRDIILIAFFLIIFGWINIAKVIRSITLKIKNSYYIEASKLIGQSDHKIIVKHIIPQLIPLVFANIAIAFPGAIIAESSLSFLGLGDPSIPTWGQILHDAYNRGALYEGLWWWILPPGIMIGLTGLIFMMIGNAIESLDPRIGINKIT